MTSCCVATVVWSVTKIAASVPQIWRGVKIQNDDPLPVIFDLLNPKSVSFNGRLSKSTTLSSFKLFGFLFYLANIHTHTYYWLDTTLLAQIIIIIITCIPHLSCSQQKCWRCWFKRATFLVCSVTGWTQSEHSFSWYWIWKQEANSLCQ